MRISSAALLFLAASFVPAASAAPIVMWIDVVFPYQFSQIDTLNFGPGTTGVPTPAPDSLFGFPASDVALTGVGGIFSSGNSVSALPGAVPVDQLGATLDVSQALFPLMPGATGWAAVGTLTYDSSLFTPSGWLASQAGAIQFGSNTLGPFGTAEAFQAAYTFLAFDPEVSVNNNVTVYVGLIAAEVPEPSTFLTGGSVLLLFGLGAYRRGRIS